MSIKNLFLVLLFNGGFEGGKGTVRLKGENLLFEGCGVSAEIFHHFLIVDSGFLGECLYVHVINKIISGSLWSTCSRLISCKHRGEFVPDALCHDDNYDYGDADGAVPSCPARELDTFSFIGFLYELLKAPAVTLSAEKEEEK